MRELNVGMIGYKFMGKAHSNAYARVNMFFDADMQVNRKVICGRDAAGVEHARQKFGWECAESDWRKMIARRDVDLVDINSPSFLHKEMAIAALREGKHVLCEKPLAFTTDDAREILAEAKKAGVKHMVGFNYRYAPAVALIKKMIDSDKLGKIFHFRGHYLQDYIIDPEYPKVWRLDKKVAGSGSLGDLGAHVIDLARYLVGEVDSVVGMEKTFVTSRPVAASMEGISSATVKADSPREPVDVDDATHFIGTFKNGALLSIEATRFAAGHRNDLTFEINGSKGSVRFSLERMHEIQYFNREAEEGLQGFTTISVTEGVHPYCAAWWPAGHNYGYEHTLVHEAYELVQAIAQDKPIMPSFEDGLKCTQIMEAAQLSAQRRAWVQVDSL